MKQISLLQSKGYGKLLGLKNSVRNWGLEYLPVRKKLNETYSDSSYKLKPNPVTVLLGDFP